MSTPFGIRSVRSTRKAINAFARGWGFSDQACGEIELCFSEALQNAMEHGSSGSSGNVLVFCAVDDKTIRIVIEDPGAEEGDLKMLESAFAANKTPRTDHERGRGIYLIRRMMDSSKMERLDKGGVRIIMTKKMT